MRGEREAQERNIWGFQECVIDEIGRRHFDRRESLAQMSVTRLRHHNSYRCRQMFCVRLRSCVRQSDGYFACLPGC